MVRKRLQTAVAPGPVVPLLLSLQIPRLPTVSVARERRHECGVVE